MATQHSRSAARFMMAPAVVLLLGWMLVPLLMTLYFSFKTYLPLRGGDLGWTGFDNYVRFVSSSAFWPSIQATLIIVGGALIITVGFGVLLGPLVAGLVIGAGLVFFAIVRSPLPWWARFTGVGLVGAACTVGRSTCAEPTLRSRPMLHCITEKIRRPPEII